MKRYSTLLVIRGLQIKNHSEIYFILIGMVVILKKQKITSAGKTVEKLETSCIIDGNVKWCGCCGKRYDGS